MFDLVNSIEEAFSQIKILNQSLVDGHRIKNRLSQAHAYYVCYQEDEMPLFGFSKFIGYKVTPDEYMHGKNYQEMNGRATEKRLQQWFVDLENDTARYNDLHEKLVDWLEKYGKKPKTYKKPGKHIKIYVQNLNVGQIKHSPSSSPSNTPTSRPLRDTSNEIRNEIFFGPPGTGKTRELLKVQRKYEPDERFIFVTFHQTYAYEDFIEGFRPVLTKDEQIKYEVRPGALRLLCQRAENDPTRRYAIFIDEINRGNIAKIFGEVITLIEKDKRTKIGNSNQHQRMKVKLPYSQEYFSIPENIDIFGAMNTADRSIAVLDFALRRRFKFIEFLPDPGEIKPRFVKDKNDDDIDLHELLAAINMRLENLIDRDHTIGHSYFMGIRSFQELCDIFRFNIFPMLQEMFYNNWSQIQIVLADNFVDDNKKLIFNSSENSNNQEQVIDVNRSTYRFTRRITSESIHKIYNREYWDKGENDVDETR